MAGRIVPPEETWRRIQPFLEKFGVTRVGDITGLDVIGIPVWFAVRPNSRSLAVSQGKGIDDSSARVSAAMEALELAHAESHRIPIKLATLKEMSTEGEIVDIAKLPRPRTPLFGTNRQIYWTQATDWSTGSPVWVPYETVHADATVPWMTGSGSFPGSSNGLASGNVRQEALLHGLYEAIERDGQAIWYCSSPHQLASRRLDLNTVDYPAALDLLEKFRRAGVTPMVWDMTSDIGIASFRAILFDERFDPVTCPLPAVAGAGCHAERGVALTRALTEAAQSRVTIIAGSRDDLDRGRYLAGQDAGVYAGMRSMARAFEESSDFHHVPDQGHGTLDEAIEHAVARLKAAGLDQVLFVDLSDPDAPIAVTRVIVPGLEGPPESPSYTPGARVRAHRASEGMP
jgi:YcaO-like protein with predicted kinase domain